MFYYHYAFFFHSGQLYSQDLLSKDSLHSTPEGPEEEDDSYLGKIKISHRINKIYSLSL